MQPDTKTSLDKDGANAPVTLRSLAEKRMSETAGRPALPIKKEDMKKLIHELQVSRIEVEIQNEGLVQARDEVEALLERFTNLYDFAPVGYFTLDHRGTIHNMNLTGAAMLGLERSLLVDRRFLAFVSQDSLPGFNAFMKTVFERKTQQSCDVEIRNQNDQPIVVRIEANVAGASQECFMAMTDITERKRIEEELQKTVLFLTSMIEQSPAPMWISDDKGTLIKLNKACCDLLNITEDDVVGKYNVLKDNIVEEQGLLPLVKSVFEKGQTAKFEIKYDSSQLKHLAPKKTAFVILDVTIFPIKDPDGRITNAVIQHNDITARKQAEEQLKHFNEELEKGIADRTGRLNASLEEKVLLLREIHHRVKNNLQIIISLLNLQSRYIQDEGTQQLIRESQNRIRAMALVHEKLYQSEDISKIHLDDYVRFLGNSLFQFYGMKGKGIVLNTQIQDINVDINTAIPVGLIVNELVSNSLKHAFPKGRKGEISVTITRENAMLTMVYKDTGVGIPPDLDWRTAKSLGLRLVVSLVEQLFGTIELDRTAGTAFTIVVREKE